MATKKKLPKMAWATIFLVGGIASIWGVTHYIDSDKLTAIVGEVSTYFIIGILAAVGLWFLRGMVKKKQK